MNWRRSVCPWGCNPLLSSGGGAQSSTSPPILVHSSLIMIIKKKRWEEPSLPSSLPPPASAPTVKCAGTLTFHLQDKSPILVLLRITTHGTRSLGPCSCPWCIGTPPQILGNSEESRGPCDTKDANVNCTAGHKTQRYGSYEFIPIVFKSSRSLHGKLTWISPDCVHSLWSSWRLALVEPSHTISETTRQLDARSASATLPSSRWFVTWAKFKKKSWSWERSIPGRSFSSPCTFT